MSHHIHANLTNIEVLTLSETGEFCALVCRRILSYLKDVLLDGDPVNQSKISRHLAVLQRHMGILGHIWSDPGSITPTIIVNYFTLSVKTHGADLIMNIKMNPTHFCKMSPGALINLLSAVFHHSLINFSGRLSTPAEMLPVRRCGLQIECTTQTLKNIFSQVPDHPAYLVKDVSHLNSIIIDLNIKYENSHRINHA
jgi:hypothetical protein